MVFIHSIGIEQNLPSHAMHWNCHVIKHVLRHWQDGRVRAVQVGGIPDASGIAAKATGVWQTRSVRREGNLQVKDSLLPWVGLGCGRRAVAQFLT